MFHNRAVLVPLAAALLALVAPRASASELPQYASDRHEGVATCAGPLCHGAARPGKHVVLQTEYYTWAEEGGDFRHSKAYDALLEPLSKRIARNLGLARPAHETKLCLDCHADNVPKKLRGAKFQIESGVGCEACHGGSERWLKPHDTGQPHALFTRDPNAPFLNESGQAACRLPAGHPEAFFEAFANVYRFAYDAMVQRAAGELFETRDTIYPNVYDGVEGMYFIQQCVESSRENGAWLALKHESARC